MTTEQLIEKLSLMTDRKAILKIIKQATIDNSTKIDDISGGDIGDSYMLKLDYDSDLNGTVDIAELAWEAGNAATITGFTVGVDVPGSAVFTDTTYTNLQIKTMYELNTNTNAFTDLEKSKLDGIEQNATADLTSAEIKSLYESNSNTNAFLDSEKTKLAGIESGATGNMTDEEIKIAYENNFQTLEISNNTTITELNRTILCITELSDVILTLPVLKDNLIINIKMVTDENNLIIKPNSSGSIEEDTEIKLTTKNESVTLICNGANWFII